MNKQLPTIRQNQWLKVLNKTHFRVHITNKILANRTAKDLVKSFTYKPFVSGDYAHVESITTTLDGRYIIAKSSWDNGIQVWDIASGECIKTLKGHTDFLDSIITTADGRHIISKSRDNTIKVWDMKSGKNVYTLYNLEVSDMLLINDDGYFKATPNVIDKYLRINDTSMSARKLTLEEIQHFKKDNLVELS